MSPERETDLRRTGPTRATARRVAVLTGLIGLMAAVPAITPATPAVAAPHADTIDLEALDMVPVRTWGVSGQNPAETQTQTIDNLVWDFVQSGNRMFVGGAFLNVQENKTATPIVQSYVAAFDVDTGDWISTWTPQLDRAVYSLDVLPNGSVLVGGEFEMVNGTAREGLVALDPLTGAIDPTFSGSVERPWSTLRATVRDLKVDGDLVYVAGNFSHLNGSNGSRTRVYKVGRFSTPTAVIDTAWKPMVTGSGIWGLDTDPGRNEVHLSGYFTAVNGEPDTGHFHTVDGTTGASVPGKIELPRNTTSQPEIFDVVYGDDLVFAVGEQHVLQVLDADDQQMLAYHHTGIIGDQFLPQGYFAGGAYQGGEKIGDVVFAGCHCTYSIRNGYLDHYSSEDGERTPHRLVMAYDAATGALIDEFMPDIHSPRDGTWAIASDTNGCLYIGGDFHVGGVDSGRPRWIGGFAKLCGEGPRVDGRLIDARSDWRYDDSGADLGTAWREPGFDDGDWAEGPAELGFGDGDEFTVMAAGNITYYARKTFSFTGERPSSLALALKADDGAIVYLNGQEILRDNLRAGTVTASTPADDWRAGLAEDFTTHAVPADALVDGENVLAVEIHNVWSGNGDLGFDVRLDPSDEIVETPPAPLVALGSDWANADSSDGAPDGWPLALTGPVATAQLGFGEGDEATVLTAGQEAYYFSRQFEVVDAAAYGDLILSLQVDDGAVVYLNGIEVLRTNMPAGPIEWNTRPLNWVGTADEVLVDHVIGAAALVDGTNTVTVEVHNFWPGNPDLSFDLALAPAG